MSCIFGNVQGPWTPAGLKWEVPLHDPCTALRSHSLEYQDGRQEPLRTLRKGFQVMMRLNIAGKGHGLSKTQLHALSNRSFPMGVTAVGTDITARSVGRCLKYVYEDGEVWAKADVNMEDEAVLTLQTRTSHCEAIITRGSSITLLAVVITDLPRGALQKLWKRILLNKRAKQ